jgi:RNA ligase
MKLDLQTLKKHYLEGYLYKVEHPNYPLDLYKYSDRTVYEKKWDEITRVCRGIVIHRETGEVIAKPFPKFFNLGEMDETFAANLPTDLNYEIYDKVDGSLGIGFFWDNDFHFATMGSFTSAQALKAKEIFDRKYAYNYGQILGKYPGVEKITLLFEIIYPENRVVIDYNKLEDLVLISGYNPKVGIELTRKWVEIYAQTLGCPIIRQFTGTVEETIQTSKMDSRSAEGFVIRFANNLRVKLKYPTYVETHKMLSKLSFEYVAKSAKFGQLSSDFIGQFPEWRKDEVREHYRKYFQMYLEISREFEEDLLKISELVNDPFDLNPLNKKIIGLAIQSENFDLKHPGMIFPYLTGKVDNVEIYVLDRIIDRYRKGQANSN